MSYWKKASFWNKVKDTIHFLGTATQLTLILGDSAHIWNFITAAAQVLGSIIAIWMEDKDKDGEVDVFQKEVITTVTSDSPIKVETKIEKKEENSAMGFTEGSETT